MSTSIANILLFENLVVGAPQSLPHGLNFNGRAITPDELIPQVGGFTVTADDTDVTVTRLTDSPSGTLGVLAKSWHSLLRAFGSTNPPPGNLPDGSLLAQPFVYTAGQAGGVAGRYAPPEQWFQDNVAASQSGVVLATRVAQLTVPFPGIVMIRDGAVVGLNTRFSESVTAGQLEVQVRINNALQAPPTVSVISTAGSNPDGGQDIANSFSFNAGDVVGLVVTTDADFLPNTLDLEAWVDIDTD